MGNPIVSVSINKAVLIELVSAPSYNADQRSPTQPAKIRPQTPPGFPPKSLPGWPDDAPNPVRARRSGGHSQTSAIGADLFPDRDAGYERRSFLERPDRIAGRSRFWSLSALSHRPAVPS